MTQSKIKMIIIVITAIMLMRAIIMGIQWGHRPNQHFIETISKGQAVYG